MTSYQAVNVPNISTSYDFVTDRIQKGDMSAEWWPTGEMTAYLLTKPNQGSIIKIFRNLIVGVMPQTDPRIGKQGNRNEKKT